MSALIKHSSLVSINIVLVIDGVLDVRAPNAVLVFEAVSFDAWISALS